MGILKIKAKNSKLPGPFLRNCMKLLIPDKLAPWEPNIGRNKNDKKSVP
jgi:hypothetical protein